MGINGQDTNIIKYSQGHLQQFDTNSLQGEFKNKNKTSVKVMNPS